MARTTLYRHFSSSTQLLAATYERLLPQVTPPLATGSLRDRLIELLSRQATLFQEAPLHLTTLAWVALGPTPGGTEETSDRQALRTRIINHYRQPFDSLLQSPDARAELDEFDLELILCQLVGPVAFARLTGLRSIDRQDCVRIVDDFRCAPPPSRPRLVGHHPQRPPDHQTTSPQQPLRLLFERGEFADRKIGNKVGADGARTQSLRAFRRDLQLGRGPASRSANPGFHPR